MPAATQSADRFVAAYVFDLLPHEYAAQLIDEAHRILRPGGLLCLASLSYGQSVVARLVSRVWTRIWRMAPRLVGGCRPIDVRGLLKSQNWEIQSDIVVEAVGSPLPGHRGRRSIATDGAFDWGAIPIDGRTEELCPEGAFSNE